MKPVFHLLAFCCVVSAPSAASTESPLTTTQTLTLAPSSASPPSAAPSTSAPNDLCPTNASSSCWDTFWRYYARGNTSSGIGELHQGALRCDSTEGSSACMKVISANNCSALSAAQYANYTAFALRCTQGGLQWVAWMPSNCSSNVTLQSLNDSTSAFCATSLNSTLVCKPTNTTPSVVTITNLLEPLFNANGCPTPAPTAKTIPLSPNPVGPEAITAIVVLVTAFIICILAAFFFWPKCHLTAEDQAKLVKKQNDKDKAREMNKEGQTNAGFSAGVGASGEGATGGGGSKAGAGVKYDAKQGSVAVNMTTPSSRAQPAFGPSAA